MATYFFVVFVALFGIACSSCFLGYEVDPETGDRTECIHGCCGEICCSGIDTTEGLAPEFIVLIVVLGIGKIIIWTFIFYRCWNRRKTVIIMSPPQQSATVTINHPLHAGYDQTLAPPYPVSTSPPPYEERTNAMERSSKGNATNSNPMHAGYD